MDVQHVIAYVTAVIVAIIAGWQTISAQLNKKAAQKSEELACKSEETAKRAGQRIDIITTIVLSMLLVEQELDGYNKNCGACRESEKCSPSHHAHMKLDRTLGYIREECEKNNLVFDYGFCFSKIHEFSFVLKNWDKEK